MAECSSTERNTNLISASGELFVVSDSIFKHSRLLATMNSVLDSESEPFPLPNVSSSCLERIINFVESNQTLFLQQIELSQTCDYFTDISIKELHELVLAANYMDMPVLLMVVSRCMGEMFRDTPLVSLAERVGFKKPDENVVRREYLNDLVLHILPFQDALCISVLDYAEVWNCISIQTNAAFQKGNCTELYLRITVPDTVARGPRRLEISVDSHDQGWSSYPQHLNTREHSWTWGEVWVKAENGNKLFVSKVYSNLHACKSWDLQSKTFNRYDDIMPHIKPGATVDLMLCARYPGWVNNTRFAEMKLYFL